MGESIHKGPALQLQRRVNVEESGTKFLILSDRYRDHENTPVRQPNI